MVKFLSRLFSRKQNIIKYYGDPNNKIIGVTMGWGLKPQLCFEGGLVYFTRDCDKLFHPTYFIDGEIWPVDPVTKEKLPIV